MKKAKAYLNILKLRLNMRLKREVVSNYPVAAYIEPTLFCNLHCPACPTGLNLDLRPTASISEELFKSAIDEMGDYIFLLYMYNWGEPLLHKRTPEMIRYAKEKVVKIVLSTNLSIKLTDDYLERLVRSGLDKLIVSLDGVNAETYKHYRRNGKFDLVRENMRRIQETKRRLGLQTPSVEWQFLVFRHNEEEVEQARAQYKEWGADEINFGAAIMPLEPHNQGFEPSTIPQYNMYHPEHMVQKETKRQLSGDRPCSWLYGAVVLNPNGKVSPCCAVASEKHDFGEFAAGDKFSSVWNNKTYRRARRLFVEWGKAARQKQQSHSVAPPAQSRAAAAAPPLVSITRRSNNDNMEVDGMSVRAAMALDEDSLICHKCPIPYWQNFTDPVVAEAASDLVSGFRRGGGLGRRARYLSNYLLMGAPGWRDLVPPGVGRAADYLQFGANPRNWAGIGRRKIHKISHHFRSL
jgi:MoaA/NifB/PqqE/SkfB family radical SAM enzyme